MNTKASIVSTATAYAHRISVGRHELVADEPPALGGQDAGLAPFDRYLASLAACTAITLRITAQISVLKTWPAALGPGL
jgi:putative redox protein